MSMSISEEILGHDEALEALEYDDEFFATSSSQSSLDSNLDYIDTLTTKIRKEPVENEEGFEIGVENLENVARESKFDHDELGQGSGTSFMLTSSRVNEQNQRDSLAMAVAEIERRIMESDRRIAGIFEENVGIVETIQKEIDHHQPTAIVVKDDPNLDKGIVDGSLDKDDENLKIMPQNQRFLKDWNPIGWIPWSRLTISRREN